MVVAIEGGGRQRREWWLNVDRRWEYPLFGGKYIASYGDVSVGESWVSCATSRKICRQAESLGVGILSLYMLLSDDCRQFPLTSSTNSHAALD